MLRPKLFIYIFIYFIDFNALAYFIFLDTGIFFKSLVGGYLSFPGRKETHKHQINVFTLFKSKRHFIAICYNLLSTVRSLDHIANSKEREKMNNKFNRNTSLLGK